MNKVLEDGRIRNGFRFYSHHQGREKETCFEFIVSNSTPVWKDLCITSVFICCLSVMYGFILFSNSNVVDKRILHSRYVWTLLVLLCITVLLILRLLLRVQQETLLVIVPVGIQFTTTFLTGRKSVIFIPWHVIKDFLILDIITGQRVLFYLAVLIIKTEKNVSTNEELLVLFQHTKPRLPCLENMYRNLQRLLRRHNT